MEVYMYLFFVLVLCGTSHTLKCYDCEAETLYACRRGSEFVRVVSCGLQHPQYLRFCLTRVVYDKINKKTQVKMGCNILGKPVNYKTIPQCTLNKTLYDLRDCRICITNFCGYLSSGQIHSICFVLIWICIAIVLSFHIFLLM